MPSGAITGVAQGAAAGAAFGPWGAVIGGAIGGIAGLASDKKAKEARRLLKKANALRTDSAMLRSFSEQRLLLRQAQLAQTTNTAGAVASGAELESSGFQGVRSSIQTQMFDNFLLGQSILNEQLDSNVYERKAGAKAGQAKDIMGMVTLGSQLVGLIPQPGAKPAPTTYGPESAFGLTSPNLSNAFDTTLINPGGIQSSSRYS